jgi:hypothetical protein
VRDPYVTSPINIVRDLYVTSSINTARDLRIIDHLPLIVIKTPPIANNESDHSCFRLHSGLPIRYGSTNTSNPTSSLRSHLLTRRNGLLRPTAHRQGLTEKNCMIVSHSHTFSMSGCDSFIARYSSLRLRTSVVENIGVLIVERFAICRAAKAKQRHVNKCDTPGTISYRQPIYHNN